jgi:hypothetical protein
MSGLYLQRNLESNEQDAARVRQGSAETETDPQNLRAREHFQAPGVLAEGLMKYLTPAHPTWGESTQGNILPEVRQE